MADYANWLTKQQTATAIGVSTKGVERFEKAGRLQKATRPAKGSPDVVVYHPDDVARLAKARQREAAPFVVPVGEDTNGNGHASPGHLVAQAIAAGGPSTDAVARALLTAVLAPLSQTSQTARLFLTLAEVAAEYGLPRHAVRQFVREGKLVPVCGRSSRSWRIRRRDLEAL